MNKNLHSISRRQLGSKFQNPTRFNPESLLLGISPKKTVKHTHIHTHTHVCMHVSMHVCTSIHILSIAVQRQP